MLGYSNSDDVKCLEDQEIENLIRKEDFYQFYEIEKEIASGHFAIVKKCHDKNNKRLEFAAKFIRKRRRGKTFRASVLNEIRIHNMISKHDRFISLYQCYETSSEIIMIMEYAHGGEIFQTLEECMPDKKVLIEENVTVRVIRQVVEALAYLHSLNIVHLDIKPSNILLTQPLPLGDIKLCDFGLSRIINSNVEMREMIGTPDYVAPEVLNYDALSTQTDMWSLGVLTYVMLTGHSPFSSNNSESDTESESEESKGGGSNNDMVQETYLNITMCNLDFPSELFDHISKEAIDFITKLCVLHPKKRMTAKQCLNHQWFLNNAKLNVLRDENILVEQIEQIEQEICDVKMYTLFSKVFPIPSQTTGEFQISPPSKEPPQKQIIFKPSSYQPSIAEEITPLQTGEQETTIKTRKVSLNLGGNETDALPKLTRKKLSLPIDQTSKHLNSFVIVKRHHSTSQCDIYTKTPIKVAVDALKNLKNVNNLNYRDLIPNTTPHTASFQNGTHSTMLNPDPLPTLQFLRLNCEYTQKIYPQSNHDYNCESPKINGIIKSPDCHTTLPHTDQNNQIFLEPKKLKRYSESPSFYQPNIRDKINVDRKKRSSLNDQFETFAMRNKSNSFAKNRKCLVNGKLCTYSTSHSQASSISSIQGKLKYYNNDNSPTNFADKHLFKTDVCSQVKTSNSKLSVGTLNMSNKDSDKRPPSSPPSPHNNLLSGRA